MEALIAFNSLDEADQVLIGFGSKTSSLDVFQALIDELGGGDGNPGDGGGPVWVEIPSTYNGEGFRVFRTGLLV